MFSNREINKVVLIGNKYFFQDTFYLQGRCNYNFTQICPCSFYNLPTGFLTTRFVRNDSLLEEIQVLSDFKCEHFKRYAKYTHSEDCLDECRHVEYVSDVSTTQLSQAFLSRLSKGPTHNNETKYITFTVYYKNFDFTRIAYHGKVISFSLYIYIFFSPSPFLCFWDFTVFVDTASTSDPWNGHPSKC